MGETIDREVYGVVSICVLVALFEGLDIQSMGVAAPRLAPAFHLDPGQMGVVMSASTVGLMIGAIAIIGIVAGSLASWLIEQLGTRVAEEAEASVRRYLDAGASSPCLGGVPGTDFDGTLEALAHLAG